jgi:hypothetical protein
MLTPDDDDALLVIIVTVYCELLGVTNPDVQQRVLVAFLAQPVAHTPGEVRAAFVAACWAAGVTDDGPVS